MIFSAGVLCLLNLDIRTTSRFPRIKVRSLSRRKQSWGFFSYLVFRGVFWLAANWVKSAKVSPRSAPAPHRKIYYILYKNNNKNHNNNDKMARYTHKSFSRVIQIIQRRSMHGKIIQAVILSFTSFPFHFIIAFLFFFFRHVVSLTGTDYGIDVDVYFCIEGFLVVERPYFIVDGFFIR